MPPAESIEAREGTSWAPTMNGAPQSENGKRRSMDILKSSAISRGLGRGLTLAVVALGLFAGLLAVLAAGASAQSTEGIPASDPPDVVYALTDKDELLRFNGNTPRQTTRQPITGLVGGESLVGIDFRPARGGPANSELYGVGDQSFIYIIDENTGIATRGPQLQRDSNADGVGDTVVPLEGEMFGVDFNPVVDRLRIVSDADQNLRVNVDTGLTIVDADLNYIDENSGTNPNVTAVAYRNSQPGATTTELYDIDTDLDILATQVDPNGGDLDEDGPLGDNVKAITGFDIVTIGTSPAGDRAFAALQPRGSRNSAFYSVNLDSGEVTRIDRINGKRTDVEGLAIPINQP